MSPRESNGLIADAPLSEVSDSAVPPTGDESCQVEGVLAVVRDRVSEVLDPCSVHNGTRLTFADLGMIDDVSVDDAGTARIRLVLDDPLCVYMVEIITGLRAAALSVDGIAEARVEIAGDELWTPDRLPARTLERMDQWRQVRERRWSLPITPVRAGSLAG